MPTPLPNRRPRLRSTDEEFAALVSEGPVVSTAKQKRTSCTCNSLGSQASKAAMAKELEPVAADASATKILHVPLRDFAKRANYVSITGACDVTRVSIQDPGPDPDAAPAAPLHSGTACCAKYSRVAGACLVVGAFLLAAFEPDTAGLESHRSVTPPDTLPPPSPPPNNPLPSVPAPLSPSPSPPRPPSPRPPPPWKRPWTRHPHTNCFAGNGATDLASAPIITGVLACQAACVALDGCEAIVVPLSASGRDSRGVGCYRRREVHLSECASSVEYDTLLAAPLPPRPPSSPQPPRSPPSPIAPPTSADAINLRMASKDGVLLHMLDNYIFVDDVAGFAGRGRFGALDSVCASIIQMQQHATFGSRIPVYDINDAGRLGGIVIRSSAATIRCMCTCSH